MHRRLPGIAVAIGLLSVGVVVGLATRPERGGDAPRPRPVLSSDADGALREICIQYRPAFHAACLQTYADFFSALSKDVVVRVVVERLEDFRLFRDSLPPDAAGNLRPLATGFPITPWSKDRFGTMTPARRDTALIAVPSSRTAVGGSRGNDARVPSLMGRKIAGLDVCRLPFDFEGGDLIADRETAYLAATCLDRNQPECEDDRPGLLARIGKALGKPVVVLGRTSDDVPGQHIGMYLTPLGPGVAAVADPDLGLTLFGTLPAAERSKVDPEGDRAKFQPFRNVIRALESRGIRVVRVPMVLTRAPLVYVTYNNAILETRAGGKHIYMPAYDLPGLDRAAARVYEAEGWTVHPVRVAKVFRNRGSLRCLVGIVARKP